MRIADINNAPERIIFYCADKETFIEISIKEEDKGPLFKIIKNGILVEEKIHPLNNEEYDLLQEKAYNWERYAQWSEAKEIYLKGKDEFEDW